MSTFFANLKARPLLIRAGLMLLYGAISFVVIYVLAGQQLDNPLLSLILELLWFLHILYIVYQLADRSGEFLLLALCGLLPGMIKNFLAVGTL